MGRQALASGLVVLAWCVITAGALLVAVFAVFGQQATVRCDATRCTLSRSGFASGAREVGSFRSGGEAFGYNECGDAGDRACRPALIVADFVPAAGAISNVDYAPVVGFDPAQQWVHLFSPGYRRSAPDRFRLGPGQHLLRFSVLPVDLRLQAIGALVVLGAQVAWWKRIRAARRRADPGSGRSFNVGQLAVN